MAMIFQMLTNEGERKPIPEARRFAHYVENVRYWFAVHDAPGINAGLVVSHWDSGKRLCMVTPGEQLAGVGLDSKALAKSAIDKLIVKVGAARVSSALRGA